MGCGASKQRSPEGGGGTADVCCDVQPTQQLQQVGHLRGSRQAVRRALASFRSQLSADVHAVKADVSTARAEMRAELSSLSKDLREIHACLGILSSK